MSERRRIARVPSPARRWRNPVFVVHAVTLLATLALKLPALAHEEPAVHENRISEEIARNPNDPSLYLRRAELHRSERNWADGVADLQTVRRLDPDLLVVDLALAQLQLEAGHPQEALVAIDRFLESHNDHAGARLTRARTLVRLGSKREAVEEFDRGIALAQRGGQGSKGAQPDDYLERARVLACDGGNVDEALRGLDEGRAASGGAITLQFLAIDLELRRQNWDAALQRLAAIEAQANRKETWMARRADVLLQAGRIEDARRLYAAALASIDALPDRLRATVATAALATQIRARLTDLQAPSTPMQLSGEAGCPEGPLPL